MPVWLQRKVHAWDLGLGPYLYDDISKQFVSSPKCKHNSKSSTTTYIKRQDTSQHPLEQKQRVWHAHRVTMLVGSVVCYAEWRSYG